MLFSIAATYYSGFFVAESKTVRAKKVYLFLGIFANIALLAYFKYAEFFLGELSRVLDRLGASSFSHAKILMPIGISFFVFQGISYLVDIYRSSKAGRHNLLDTALYISMFPQLVAGPIVRYASIAEQLRARRASIDDYAEGLTRFCFGLAKKALIANPVGAIADSAFSCSSAELTLPLAWMGIVAYTFQIYFDFSGYSDMAIGIGKALGFTFPENFNYPYISKSLTEFWRRWHISLSTWFRDYLYIPLGGNRKGLLRTNINLFVVFAVTGFWHGANWTFILWGLWHGLFLVLEKYLRRHIKIAIPNFLRLIYCILTVMIGWVLFRSSTLSQAIYYLKTMFSLHDITVDMIFFSQLTFKNMLVLLIAFPLAAGLGKIVATSNYLSKCTGILVFFTAYVFLVSSSYNPFIYFRF
jgi:alginate O-acetyltransferase complex protein AlgI